MSNDADSTDPVVNAGPQADDQNFTRLTSHYPDALTDFNGSATPCIYRKGPKWPVNPAINTDVGFPPHVLVRAARPIYEHPIQPVWLKLLWEILGLLNSMGVQWSTIDPLAYANEGEAELVCDFVVVVGVKARSLGYDAAVAAAEGIGRIFGVRRILLTPAQVYPRQRYRSWIDLIEFSLI